LIYEGILLRRVLCLSSLPLLSVLRWCVRVSSLIVPPAINFLTLWAACWVVHTVGGLFGASKRKLEDICVAMGGVALNSILLFTPWVSVKSHDGKPLDWDAVFVRARTCALLRVYILRIFTCRLSLPPHLLTMIAETGHARLPHQHLTCQAVCSAREVNHQPSFATPTPSWSFWL
jgi:hypothetical protein